MIKYGRSARVKYISHLDFVRMFHRTARRAGLDFEFSQGFNPHPIMTVAVPLSVGVTADGEVMSVGFETVLSEKGLKDMLNDYLPDGFFVKEVKKSDGKKYDFNLIEYAEYFLNAECENPDSFDSDALLANPELLVLKKTKSGEKEADIKPLIKSVEKVAPESGNLGLQVVVSAGNTATLKPETLVLAINKYLEDVKIGFFATHRTALLTKDLKPLL